MTPLQRINEAKTTVNDTLKLLSEAQTAGWRYQSSGEATAKPEWTDERVIGSVRAAMKAIDVLCEESGSDRLKLEKTRNGLLNRMLGLGLHRQILTIVLQTRSGLLEACGVAWTPVKKSTNQSHRDHLGEWLQVLSIPSPVTGDAAAIIHANLMMSWIAWLASVQGPGDLQLLLPMLDSVVRPHSDVLPFDVHVDPSVSSQYCSNLYARVLKLEEAKLAPSSRIWLHFRFHLASLALSPKSVVTPAVLWNHATRSLSRFATDKETWRQATEIIETVLQDLQPRVIQEWVFQGKEWLDFVDYWMNLGRKLEDLSIVEKASSFLPGSVESLASELDGLAIAPRFESQLATNAVRLALSPPDADALVREDLALQSRLCAAIGQGAEVDLVKLVTAWDRLRRKMLPAMRQGVKYAKEWLDGWTINCQDILGSSRFPDLATIVIDTLLHFVRIDIQPGDFDSHDLASKKLSFAIAIRDAFPVDHVDSAEWSRCISAAFYNTGVALWRANLAVPAIPFVRSSCLYGREALDRPRDTSSEHWQALEEQLTKRWELLAACYLKAGEKLEALRAYLACLTALPSKALQQARTDISSQTPSSALRPFATVLLRMGSLLQSEALLFSQQAHLFDLDPLLAACVEEMARHVETAQHRPEVADLLANIWRHVLAVYDAETYPVRRLRVLSRATELAVNTGRDASDYIEDATELAERTELANDEQIGQHRAEYALHIKISRAVQAFYDQGDFATLARGVVDQLASMLVPTASPAIPRPDRNKGVSRTRAKPEAVLVRLDLDDRKHLCDRVSYLVSLLSIGGSSTDIIKCMHLLHKLQRITPALADASVTSSRLALEYLKLGKADQALRIFNQVPRSELDDPQRIEIDLAHSRTMVHLGNREKGVEMYRGCLKLSESLDEPKQASSTAKIHQHATKLHHAASAYLVAAEVHLSEDDATSGLACISKCFRLLNRAADSLARLAYKQEAKSDPFDLDAAPADAASRRIRSRLPELSSRVTASVLEVTLLLSRAMLDRGSAKDAECFIGQAKDLAAAVGSRRWLARAEYSAALLSKATGQYNEALEAVERAVDCLSDTLDKAIVDCQSIRHAIQMRRGDPEAKDTLSTVEEIMQRLEGELADVEDLSSSRLSHASPRRPQTKHAMDEVHLDILREQVRACRNQDTEVDIVELEQRVQGASGSVQLLAMQRHLSGSISLAKTMQMFRDDLFLNSLMDSMISLPVGCASRHDASVLASRHELLETLQQSRLAFRQYLNVQANSGSVDDVRFASVASAMLRAYNAYVGKDSKSNTAGTAALLDRACGITLSRELLDSLVNRDRDAKEDLLVWPSLAESTTCQSRHATRHKSDQLPDLSSAPEHWVVIHINISEDSQTLFITRHQRDRDPLIFCLPIDRQGKREDEDETFSFADAVDELRSIIRDSDDSARTAKDISARNDKVEWWARRKALDKRLEELLGNIEFVWLGAFKTIFNQHNQSDPASLATFRKSIDRAFRQGLGTNRLAPLDPDVLNCLATLSPKSKEQEIEDLVYFILDLHQLSGQPVAIAEVDIEQLSLDVLTAIQALQSSQSRQPEEQIFLVLDRKTQELPWESMPILRQRVVSRVPNIAFLLDRLPSDSVDQQTNRVHYILNPSKDLVRTQDAFQPWLEKMAKERGWTGIIGREPTELEVSAALRANDCLLYFGHGGMEQFIRSQKIRSLDRCATVMLWGCSSGALKDMGDLDRTGTPLNYMIAGSPSVTVNLWDVTDKDIDKLSTVVLEQVGLCEGQGALSTTEALPKARDSCKLKYLTGAAPVHYGVPVWFHGKK